VVLPTDHKPTKVMEPSEKSYHSPTSAVAAQRATILSRRSGALRDGVRSLDALTLGQVRIQTVTVVGFVADQSRREGVEEAVSEEAVDELAFVRRSAFDTNGERKAVIPGESDDFRSLATFGGPDRSTTIYETSSILRLRAWSVRRDIRFARKQVRSWTH
jgi:hypothetical protein